MPLESIAEFDPSPYLTLPRMPVTEMLTLGKVLVHLAPEGPWPEVETAADRVQGVIVDTETIMVNRIRDGGRYTREDVKFDGFVDGIWALLRDRLGGWSRYASEGRQHLAQDQELDVDLEELELRAERASAVLDRLFADGLDLLRRSYNEQAQLMANLLGVIEAEQLDDEIAVLAGEEMLPMLRAAQRRYEQMVNERLARDKNATIGDLRQRRGLIQRYIYFYTNAVIGTLNRTPPNTVESVEAALLPIINVRAGRDSLLGRRAASASPGGDELGEDEQTQASEPAA